MQNRQLAINVKWFSKHRLVLFLKKRAEIITKLATVDGIPVNAITKSEFIRKALIYQGYSLPKNPSQVMELIHSHYEEIKLYNT